VVQARLHRIKPQRQMARLAPVQIRALERRPGARARALDRLGQPALPLLVAWGSPTDRF
jgi:hypothetical protein